MASRKAIALYTGYKPSFLPDNEEHPPKVLIADPILNAEPRPQPFSLKSSIMVD